MVIHVEGTLERQHKQTDSKSSPLVVTDYILDSTRISFSCLELEQFRQELHQYRGNTFGCPVPVNHFDAIFFYTYSPTTVVTSLSSKRALPFNGATNRRSDS